MPPTVDLFRVTYTLNSTQGLLSVDGTSQFCTLEPSQQSGKLMPAGTYLCVKTMSERLQYVTPELQAVPGHVGERIHIGNKPEDTEGCILIGTTRSPDWINFSHQAFEQFMFMVPDEFYITIHDQPAV